MHYLLGEHTVTLTCPLLHQSEAKQLQTRLIRELPWRQEQIRLFGRLQQIPRTQCWIGDPDARYSYSGLSLDPEPWPPWLTALRDRVSLAAGTTFNSVLCNHYRHGQDSMGWHSDDEPELGRDPVIASVSLGEERRFHFRHRREQSRRLQLVLPHNSLLIMPAGLQSDWQHQVPKSQRVMESRINLTFRHVVRDGVFPDNG